MPIDCPHHPPCGRLVTHWVCGQRTNAESAVKRGLITRESAERLMLKYGVRLTPASKVFVGNVVEREPVTTTLFPKEK